MMYLSKCSIILFVTLVLFSMPTRKATASKMFSKEYHQAVQSFTFQDLCKSDGHCPPWIECNNKTCMCKNTSFFDGILKCDNHTGDLVVLDCHCVTYDNKTGDIVAGSCIENCMNVTKHLYDEVYSVSLNPSDNMSTLNEKMCGHFNRDGQLCGKCLPGYSPLAYSFNMTCVNCTEGNWNLWKYFLIAFAPLTCFYFLVLFFKINTTSSHLNGLVIFAQAIALPMSSRVMLLAVEHKPKFKVPITILCSLYGVWNLDFFRMFNLEICLDMSPLSVRALDYMIAAYPFFLTTLSYILIELHDRNFRVLVFLWKPFRCIFTLFRRNWDIRTSVIDAYATFYMLSFFKILCISFDILIPTYVHKVGYKNMTKLVSYYDGTVDYFGPEHLPYAISALVLTILFGVFPILLLIIYPCRCFQHLLNRSHYRWHILHTFMDSFQGCYKNGTEPGTRDCRWFVGFEFFVRIVMYIVFSITLGSLYYPLGIIVILLLMMLYVNIQPHKAAVSHYNKITVTFYSLVTLFYASLTSANIASIKSHYFVKGCYILALLVSIIPLIYMSCISIHWIVSRRKWGKEFVSRIRAWWMDYELLEDSSFPDRILHPDQYTEQGMEDTLDMETDNHSSGISYTD